MREITIGDRKLGDGHEPWIVAEVGVNHDGSVAQALEMVRSAAKASVDVVKFGVFKADEFCAKSDPLYETFKRCELPDDAWFEIKAECERNKVIFFATPQNESDLEILLKVGVPCVKVGSDDLTNTALIASYAKHGWPMILSTGMADIQDIKNAVWAIDDHGRQICGVMLLVCTSEYPCPPEHTNLARITTLRNEVKGLTIGFSDHTQGVRAAIIAASLGACYFEKHFTLDNALPGPDHAFSANPHNLKKWADAIRKTRLMLGSGKIEPTETEKVNRVKWRRASGQQIRGTA